MRENLQQWANYSGIIIYFDSINQSYHFWINEKTEYVKHTIRGCYDKIDYLTSRGLVGNLRVKNIEKKMNLYEVVERTGKDNVVYIAAKNLKDVVKRFPNADFIEKRLSSIVIVE